MTVQDLPTQPTAFIGREEEIIQITGRLGDPACRLLTLVGAGGVGKTRLAIQVARHALSDFVDGVYLVPLAPLKSSDNLISTIGISMHFPFHSNGDPHEQLLDFLREKKLLLVLDNFEHLLTGVNLVKDMLEAAPRMKILVTSRETLNLQQEWVREIDGLEFPESEQTIHPERYDAVQLLTACASRVRADFSFERDIVNLVRICKLVKGIPLAIELAAVWLKTLSSEDVVTEIQRNVDFLSSQLQDIPERHQSIRAVFTWSWLLLSEEERTVFRKLTVFRGGFRRKAAEEVVGASSFVLSALVGKSLVKRNDSGRYEIHELLRQYGEEQLTTAGEAEAVQDAHCYFFAESLRQREADLKGKRQLAALREIDFDFENIRAAWTWAANRKISDALTAAMGCLLLFCDMRSRFQEGHQFFELAARCLSDTPDPPSRVLLQCLMARKVRMEVLGYLSHREEARTQIEKCLEAARERGDAEETAFCLSTLGELILTSESMLGAVSSFEAALRHYQQVGEKFCQGRTLQRLALSYYHSRFDLDLFAQFAQKGYEISRDVGDWIGTANCLYNLGTVHAMQGNYVAEERYQSEALAIRRETGDLANISVNLAGLCHAVLNIGDLERGRALAQEALEIATRINHLDGRDFALMELGFLAILDGDYQQGQRICEESRAITTQIAVNPLRTALVDSYLALAGCGLGNYKAARHHLQTSLQYGANAGLFEPIKWGLPAAAIVKAQEGYWEQAIELLATAWHSPASIKGWAEKCPLISGLINRLKQQFGSVVFDEYWESGSDKSFAEIVIMLERFQLLPAAAAVSEDKGCSPANHNNRYGLTNREIEMMRLIATGLSNQEISEQLVIGISTVKKHINHIFGKLGVKSRTQAIVVARQLGLL